MLSFKGQITLFKISFRKAHIVWMRIGYVIYVDLLFWRIMAHCKLILGSLAPLRSFLYAPLTYSSCTPDILFMQWPGFCLFSIVQSPTTYTWSKTASSILF